MKRETVVVRIARRPAAVTHAPALHWMTQDECAKHLGISTRTLIEYRKHGLPTVLIPGAGRPYFCLESVDHWLLSHEQRAV